MLGTHACWKNGTVRRHGQSQYVLSAHSMGQQEDTLQFTALQRPQPRSMLKAGRLAKVYGALRATALRPAKENYGKKL